jgi:D-alanyl-D-alanine carboxypeptidase
LQPIFICNLNRKLAPGCHKGYALQRETTGGLLKPAGEAKILLHMVAPRGDPATGLLYGLVVIVGTLLSLSLGAKSAAAAVSSIVIDQASGRELSARNADAPRYPASLTKMMTLYLLFDAIEQGRVGLNTRLRVSRRAASQPPSKLGLRPGQTITVRQAMLALATKSANDAAVVVAEGLAGSEAAFARKMTAKARALGMRRTTFRNASGLHHPRQRTSAREMAMLGRALLRNHPDRYGIFATRSFRWGRASHGNHNRLMSAYRGMDGIKTGYTRSAGFNLVASANRKGRRLVGVVMGSRSAATRNGLMASLLDQGFDTQPGRLIAGKEKQGKMRSTRRSTKPKAVTAKKGSVAKSRMQARASRNAGGG